MRGVNKVVLIGTLGRDVEVRQTQSGSAVSNMALATNERWEKKDGSVEEHTEWHSVVLFGRRAELAGEYLRKGSKVYIEGKLRTRKWQSKDGQERQSTEVVAQDMQFLDRRNPNNPQQQGSYAAGRGKRDPQAVDGNRKEPVQQIEDDDIAF